MHITISTPVRDPLDRIVAGFNADLLKKLNPPFPRVKLLRWDGNSTGDQVELELHFVIYRQKWVSRITDHDFSAKKYRFTDEGVVLPSSFKSWRHQHVITDEDSFRLIRDQVEYHSANRVLELILYPFLWSLFYYRKAIYQKIFGQMN